MDNVSRRKRIWKKVKPFMDLTYSFAKLLPESFCAHRLEKLRFKTGWGAMARRYVLLKRLGASFNGDDYCIIQSNVCIYHPAYLKLGERITINDNSYFECSGGIEIGNDVLIGHGVSILSNTHNYQRNDIPVNVQGETFGKITIGNNVWIGAKTTILKGVTIGNNAVIGAHALVNRDVNENEIVAGVPARVIKTRLLDGRQDNIALGEIK